MIPAGQFLYVSNPLGKVRSLRSQRLRGRPSGRMGSAPATGAADCDLVPATAREEASQPKGAGQIVHETKITVPFGCHHSALAVCSLPPPSGAFSIQLSVISRSPQARQNPCVLTAPNRRAAHKAALAFPN